MAELLVTERLNSKDPRLNQVISEHGNAINRMLTGQNILYLVDGVEAPDAIVGVAQIYIDISGGDLKVKFGDGTVKTIVTDT